MPTMPLNPLAPLRECFVVRLEKRNCRNPHFHAAQLHPARPRHASRRRVSRQERTTSLILAGWSFILLTPAITCNKLFLLGRIPRTTNAKKNTSYSKAPEGLRRRPTFDLQLRNRLGRVPWNDSASFQLLATWGTRAGRLPCFAASLVCQHSQCACRTLRRFPNPRRTRTCHAPRTRRRSELVPLG